MEKITKDELLTMVKVFERINGKIEKNQIIDIDTLVQCQTQAVDLGNYIELVYKDVDTSHMIHILEEYCEYVYQLSLNIDNGEKRKKVKKVRKLLILLQNDITYKLPDDKKEVVFLPYKASMWDSLESIWLAAKEDEGVEEYVVPIPYFDRKPDGSMGQMHYEGGEFPDYVPITSWYEYVISERKPDVIYIHNPYDDWNSVTNVSSLFYAKELRKYTGLLVYIPYFVLRDISLKDEAAIEEMRHFCFLPGTIYANKVILQSEDMKCIYINEFIKEARKRGLDGSLTNRKILEDKFLGLGSPKYDMVQRTTKKEWDIPEKWQQLVKKSDGSWKKIVFYNTSIAAFLNDDEDMLLKMKNVFSYFATIKDDIVLLWRPHPLLKDSIKSMRPHLLSDYLDLILWFKQQNFGIYDDTSDLERAIALSDAYYGDRSSIVQLYQKTGKPILLQNAKIKV